MVSFARISYSVVKVGDVFNIIRVTPNREQFICTTDDYTKAILLIQLLSEREAYDRQRELPNGYVPWNC